jgi:hypothetical protein
MVTPKRRKPNAKIEEARTEQGRKKNAEKTSPNDYIYKRNKAELINLITEFIKGTKPKGVFTKKAVKIAYQDIISVL